MSTDNDRYLTPKEKSEIKMRKVQIEIQKKSKQTSSLDELKKELGIPAKEKK